MGCTNNALAFFISARNAVAVVVVVVVVVVWGDPSPPLYQDLLGC